MTTGVSQKLNLLIGTNPEHNTLILIGIYYPRPCCTIYSAEFPAPYCLFILIQILTLMQQKNRSLPLKSFYIVESIKFVASKK